MNKKEFFIIIKGFDFAGSSMFHLNKSKNRRSVGWFRASALIHGRPRNEIRKTKKA